MASVLSSVQLERRHVQLSQSGGYESLFFVAGPLPRQKASPRGIGQTRSGLTEGPFLSPGRSQDKSIPPGIGQARSGCVYFLACFNKVSATAWRISS